MSREKNRARQKSSNNSKVFILSCYCFNAPGFSSYIKTVGFERPD